jgi:spermidine/putrescine transport system ATP-binding protein
MLELKNVFKTFDASHALKPTNLTVKDGEFFSLLGPSGCGKTTLLRILGGFETPTGGEVLFDGKSINTLRPQHRPFNMVFQRYALFPHLSVWNNVAFGLKIQGISKAEINTRVENALGIVRMLEHGQRFPETLSGGQQQRVALARAIVNRPRILLLDEPLSALDLKLRQKLQRDLLDIQRLIKTTFIYVTHDQEEALTLSDRIAVMSEGQIEQIGSPSQIYSKPKTLFVASFIGSTNSLVATVTHQDDKNLYLKSDKGTSLSVLKTNAGSGTTIPGTKVTMVIRPEKLKIGRPDDQTPEQNRVKGKVAEILFKGHFTELSLALSGETKRITASFPTEVWAKDYAGTVKKRESCELSWLASDCLLFAEKPAPTSGNP